MSKELKDVADEVIDLEEIFFQKPNKRCYHVALTSFFVPRFDEHGKRIGCFMRCAGCNKIVIYWCGKNCAVGEIVTEVDSGHSYFVLPCDALDGKEKGLYKK